MCRCFYSIRFRREFCQRSQNRSIVWKKKCTTWQLIVTLLLFSFETKETKTKQKEFYLCIVKLHALSIFSIEGSLQYLTMRFELSLQLPATAMIAKQKPEYSGLGISGWRKWKTTWISKSSFRTLGKFLVNQCWDSGKVPTAPESTLESKRTRLKRPWWVEFEKYVWPFRWKVEENSCRLLVGGEYINSAVGSFFYTF